MLEEMPDLAFISIDKMRLHEWHDDQRTPPLIERLQASGIIRNPPIVTPLQDESERYMVLDGANRFTALQEMGYPHALVQVVQPDDPGLNLENWNHVIWGMNPKDFFTGIREISDLNLKATLPDSSQPSLWKVCDLALVQVPNGDCYTVCTPAEELVQRVALLNAIVDSYKDKANLDRTNGCRVDALKDIYPQLSGLVIFPHFEVRDVLNLASAGHLLPAGITRFTVSPRALHVNYPLEELAADIPLEEKNAKLQDWIQERIARKGVRYYAEATFLFDE
jgi:L-serine kinase (ATP) / ParB family transcriptional regulator, heme-responsive regulator